MLYYTSECRDRDTIYIFLSISSGTGLKFFKIKTNNNKNAMPVIQHVRGGGREIGI